MTIQEVNNKSLQEIFDFVANHLLAQNGKAIENDMCRYRSGNLKCAVGALIADEDYDCKFENSSIRTLRDKLEGSIFADISEPKLILLMHLQSIHDTRQVASWPEALSGLAKELSLNDEILKEFETDEEH